MTANYVNNNNTDNDTAKNSKNRLYTYNIPFLNSSLTAILTIVLASLKNVVVGGGGGSLADRIKDAINRQVDPSTTNLS